MPRPSEPTKNGSKMNVVLKAMGNSRRLQILTQLADGSKISIRI
jgi:DNA-binding transcriptional ArsR family regulator